MKVTFDTQVDSFEDIRKVMHILSSVIERKENGTIENKPAPDTTSLMSMFGEAAPETKTDSPPDFSSFLNLTKKGDDKKDYPRVEIF